MRGPVMPEDSCFDCFAGSTNGQKLPSEVRHLARLKFAAPCGRASRTEAFSKLPARGLWREFVPRLTRQNRKQKFCIQADFSMIDARYSARWNTDRPAVARERE